MLTRVVTRATELALILVGLGFIFVSVDDDELVYLGIWDLLAVCYVGVGVIALRRSRLRPPRSTPEATSPRPVPVQFRVRDRLQPDRLHRRDRHRHRVDSQGANPDDYAVLLNILGVVAMIMSWMLLQAGYARRYAAMYRATGGLTFPDTDHPAPVEFLYFAVTIGTAFSVSDVLVTTSRMRWHVMVHSAVSFFYNAAVVAFALSLIAGR